MSKTIIKLENVYYSYEKKLVLENINLTIKEGMFMGLVGPNGGGKTTLIKIILGLLKPQRGNVYLLDKPIDSFKDWNRIGYVSQKANTFNKGFPATVFEVVSMGLTAKVGYFRFFNKHHKERVLEAIRQVDLESYAYENIGNLSGGQQQRVFIARALVSDPQLLILDEPTVGIDYQNVKRFYDLLYKLNKEKNITMLLVTHDTGAVTKYATEIACINQKLHFHGEACVINRFRKKNCRKYTVIPYKSSCMTTIDEQTKLKKRWIHLCWQIYCNLNFYAHVFYRLTRRDHCSTPRGVPCRQKIVIVGRCAFPRHVGRNCFRSFYGKTFSYPVITPFYSGMLFSVIGALLIEKLRFDL